MGDIIILDESTSNKIAAGEVIERPASVVKELVENSIDAGAEIITVEIKNGGISYIKVSDNGSGIKADDVEIAFERHATSKIRSSEDLGSILTLGFRGEALASIAAVSSVELITRTRDSSHGTFIRVQGGVIKEIGQTGCPVGSIFIVRDLFYNTPARYKFLKNDSTEARYVSDIINRLALGNPDISFRFISNNTKVLHTPGNNDLLSTIFSIYGKQTVDGLCEINYRDKWLIIKGYAGKPEIARSNRNHQSIFINGRYIKSKLITSAIDEAYSTLLMKNKFAFIVMNIELDTRFVDVNVHPAKLEVRFSEEQEIFRSVYNAIASALTGEKLIPSVSLYDVKSQGSDGKGPSFINDDTGKNAIRGNLNHPADFSNSIAKYGFTGSAGKKDEYVQQSIDFEESREDSGSSYVQNAEGNRDFHRYNNAKDCQYNNARDYHSNGKDYYSEGTPSESFLDQVRIIGQAFSTYIILQHDDDLLIIDQHAAHERIMYEKLKEKYHKNMPMTQLLVTPVVVELTNNEMRIAEEYKEYFSKLGYIFENFGNNSIVLRSVPGITDPELVRETFLDALDLISGTNPVLEDAADETLYNIACKAAVKANKRLDEVEIKALLEELKGIANLFSCPHGRPTIIRISKNELEKKFKRIV